MGSEGGISACIPTLAREYGIVIGYNFCSISVSIIFGIISTVYSIVKIWTQYRDPNLLQCVAYHTTRIACSSSQILITMHLATQLAIEWTALE